MTRYTVQFTMPVDNPVNNVRMRRSQDGKIQTIHFEVPINLPDAHNVGLVTLLGFAELCRENEQVIHKLNKIRVESEEA